LIAKKLNAKMLYNRRYKTVKLIDYLYGIVIFYEEKQPKNEVKMKIAILFQNQPPPEKNGIKKLMKAGGYSDRKKMK